MLQNLRTWQDVNEAILCSEVCRQLSDCARRHVVWRQLLNAQYEPVHYMCAVKSKLTEQETQQMIARHANHISGTSGCRGHPQKVPFDSQNVISY